MAYDAVLMGSNHDRAHATAPALTTRRWNVLATASMRARPSRPRHESGQDLAEYGIALSVVGVVALAAALAIGTNIGFIWDPVETSIDDVAHGHHGPGHGHGNGNGNGNGNGP